MAGRPSNNNNEKSVFASLRSVLEKNKLTGSNFLEWERNLRIVLRHERKWYVLETPLGEAPQPTDSAAVRNAYKKHTDDLVDVQCLMLGTMDSDLQVNLMEVGAYDMIRQLRDTFQVQARTERYNTTRALNACKMASGSSVSTHVMKMKGYMDHLERLGYPISKEMGTDLILNSLTDDYKQFVINFQMNNLDKTVPELHNMLKTAEQSLGIKPKDTKDVLMVRKEGRIGKKRTRGSRGRGKKVIPEPEPPRKAAAKPKKAKDERCFECQEKGHWRRDCPKLKNKKQADP